MNLFVAIFLLFFVKGYAQNTFTSEQTLRYSQDVFSSVHPEDVFADNLNTEYILTDDDNQTNRTIELTDRYPSNLWNFQTEKFDIVTVQAEQGYRISVGIVQCSLNGEESYIRISGKDLNDMPNTITFAYDVREQYTYLFNTNKIDIEINATRASGKFIANFSRFGEKMVPTTTPIPTTTIILPTPRSNESAEITVYLTGKEPYEFKNLVVLNELKEIIRLMAEQYCTEENFPLAENITLNNIIARIFRCPKNWPDPHKCAQLRFGVPVLLKEHSSSPWKGYQLNSRHLEIMWDRFAAKYLPNDTTIRNPPNTDAMVDWQIGTAVLVIIVFGLILIGLRYVFVVSPEKKRNRKLSDTASIISGRRSSQVSLPPHYLQETPPLFDTTYTMFEPMDDPRFANPFEFSEFRKSPENDAVSETSEIIEESGA